MPITFWYHPHMDGLQQLGRGLAGALMAEIMVCDGQPQP